MGNARARGKTPHEAAPPSERLVYTVPEAGRLLGLSRNGSYEAAKRGEIPTIKVGRLLLVPKVAFHRMLECGNRDAGQEQRFQGVATLDRHGRGSGGARS